jgi:hypothetical protein
MLMSCTSSTAYTSLLLPVPGISSAVSFAGNSSFCMDLAGSATDGTNMKVGMLLNAWATTAS